MVFRYCEMDFHRIIDYCEYLIHRSPDTIPPINVVHYVDFKLDFRLSCCQIACLLALPLCGWIFWQRFYSSLFCLIAISSLRSKDTGLPLHFSLTFLITSHCCCLALLAMAYWQLCTFCCESQFACCRFLESSQRVLVLISSVRVPCS